MVVERPPYGSIQNSNEENYNNKNGGGHKPPSP